MQAGKPACALKSAFSGKAERANRLAGWRGLSDPGPNGVSVESHSRLAFPFLQLWRSKPLTRRRGTL
jgi:hypothetical protein